MQLFVRSGCTLRWSSRKFGERLVVIAHPVALGWWSVGGSENANCRICGVCAAFGALIGVAILIFIAIPSTRSILTAISALVTASVAVAALIIARQQLRHNRESLRETTAKTTFRDFLKLCVENPELAYGDQTQQTQRNMNGLSLIFSGPLRKFLNTIPRPGRTISSYTLRIIRTICRAGSFAPKIGQLTRQSSGNLLTKHLSLWRRAVVLLRSNGTIPSAPFVPATYSFGSEAGAAPEGAGRSATDR